MLKKTSAWTILAVCVVLSATLLTWCYFQVNIPRKEPVRAKQVLILNIDKYS